MTLHAIGRIMAHYWTEINFYEQWQLARPVILYPGLI